MSNGCYEVYNYHGFLFNVIFIFRLLVKVLNLIDPDIKQTPKSYTRQKKPFSITPVCFIDYIQIFMKDAFDSKTITITSLESKYYSFSPTSLLITLELVNATMNKWLYELFRMHGRVWTTALIFLFFFLIIGIY